MVDAETTITTLRALDDGVVGAPRPGLVAVFSNGAPVLAVEALDDGPLDVGRHSFGGAVANDDRLSRRHARVELAEGGLAVTDFGSTNGTSIDGEPLHGTVVRAGTRALRVGRTVIVPVPDVTPFEGTSVEDDARGIAGPTLRAAWTQIALVAPRGEALFVRGESGAGKELAARLFHALGPTASGPFVAVNCATIPAALAERLLFGAKRGAYSGADADADGFVQAASGGTLFLDEVADLDLAVQAKLLRVVETKEVLPLGASKGKKVALRVVTATHRDLRAQVAEARFREDLYFRIGRPEVLLPPLRSRAEEIPWHLLRAVRSVDPSLGITAALVEACLLRPWPGNVRELASEARLAGERARAEGKSAVTATHLGPGAGMPIRVPATATSASVPPPAAPPVAESLPPPPPMPRPMDPPSAPDPRDATYGEALARASGNVSRAAELLGVHRNRVRRWLEKKRRP